MYIFINQIITQASKINILRFHFWTAYLVQLNITMHILKFNALNHSCLRVITSLIYIGQLKSLSAKI